MARALRSPSMKLTETPATQRTTHSTSSPITIPKKPPRVALSTPTSSSASLGESSSVPSRVDADDNLSVLPSTGQQLQHTAARDRISVKNARRQPLKQKLSTLRENDDQSQENNKHTVLSSTPTDDESVAPSTRTTEVKAPQPLIDLSDISSARARLRMSVRTRDRSADNLLLAKTTSNEIETHSTENPLTPKLPSVIQRSVSFKRPQEIQEKTPLPRPLVLRKIDNDEPSSSQEHIYDNLDVFKTETSEVKTRDNVGKASIRLRPVTMHVATSNDESSSSSSTPNEFEQIFNQLKKRGSIRRVRVPEETPPVVPPTPPPIEPEPTPPPVEPEPTPVTVTVKPPTVLPSPQPAPRRKTLGTHKVAIEEPKPTPSWIDIAKQKQTKFQTGSNDGKTTSEENQPDSAPKSPVISRKTTPSSETRLNRQSMFETSALSNTHPIERDSIRALKAGNPNRINNLIQFFDK